MGWQPDLPDARDYTLQHPEVLPLLHKLKRPRHWELPDEVDLRSDTEGEYFTETEDQGPLNSSTAFAVLALIEYFERRLYGHTFEGSKQFLYKVTRNRIARGRPAQGDTGADLRSTLKVVTQFGVPPEEFWPYDRVNFDNEPNAFLYGLAKPFSNLRYFRLDGPNATGETTWKIVKSFLSAGFPIAFGFPVPSSLNADSHIPFRPTLDARRGGQVVVAMGYRTDDLGPGKDSLLVRSSWGNQWGDNGNGWLPISYIRNQLAKDFWTLMSEDWLSTGELSRPTVSDPKQDAN